VPERCIDANIAVNMTEATKWRFRLAEKIAASYARNPKAEVVMIAGSVARGSADRFSDIEVDVYYSEPPTEEERIAAVEGCGGTLKMLDQDDDEWEEQMLFNGFHAASSTFLVETMERYLTQVVDKCQIAPSAQVRLYSLQHSVPIKGGGKVEKWRARAAAYPKGLVFAMLRENLPFHGFWYAEEMLAARGDLLLLYDIFVRVERQIIGALLGLNRIYMPTPDHIKWMDEMIGTMRLKPDNLSERLKRAFRIEPEVAVRELKEIIAEVLTLVEKHAPEFDTTPYRANFAKGRGAWDKPPVGIW
jgi:hypothetical protein